jgi:hypothetical protein
MVLQEPQAYLEMTELLARLAVKARQEPRVLLARMARLARQELLARLARAVQMEQGLHITDKSPESQTAQYQSLLLGHINQPD